MTTSNSNGTKPDSTKNKSNIAESDSAKRKSSQADQPASNSTPTEVDKAIAQHARFKANLHGRTPAWILPSVNSKINV